MDHILYRDLQHILLYPELLDHISSLLSDHNNGRVRISTWDCRHHAGIHHTQSTDAVYSQLGINYSCGIPVRSHFARANWMVNSHRIMVHHTLPIRICVDLQVGTAKERVR